MGERGCRGRQLPTDERAGACQCRSRGLGLDNVEGAGERPGASIRVCVGVRERYSAAPGKRACRSATVEPRLPDPEVRHQAQAASRGGSCAHAHADAGASVDGPRSICVPSGHGRRPITSATKLDTRATAAPSWRPISVFDRGISVKPPGNSRSRLLLSGAGSGTFCRR